jgi:hypothetical protein
MAVEQGFATLKNSQDKEDLRLGPLFCTVI